MGIAGEGIVLEYTDGVPPLSSTDEIQRTFAEQRYVKVEGMLEAPLAKMLYEHIERRRPMGRQAKLEELQGAIELFSDRLMEFVLASLQPRVEELSGCRLDPTYSFTRVYFRGHALRRHTDRPSCEVSVSINLGPQLEKPWPIWVKGPLSEAAVGLAPGDGVLYRGIECEHWRDPLEADHTTQVFLHYVEKDGKYSEWKYDKRTALGTEAPTESPASDS